MSYFNILFCCDNNYLKFLLVLVQSIFDNSMSTAEERNKRFFKFHVVVDNSVDIEATKILFDSFLTRNQANSFAEFNFYSVDPTLFVNSTAFSKGSDPSSKGAYYRLVAPDLLPKDVDKVLYLDIDILAVGDITEIFQSYSLDNKLLGVVRDLGILKSDCLKARSDANETIIGNQFISNAEDLFNSGVLFINLELWRKHSISAKALSVSQNYKAVAHDQSVLYAIAFSDLVKNEQDFNGSAVIFMDSKYNFQQIGYLLEYNDKTNKYDKIRGKLPIGITCQSADEFEYSLSHTVIAHFTNSKPWRPQAVREHHGLCFVSHPYFDLYMAKWRETAAKIPEANIHLTEYSLGESIVPHLETLYKKIRKISKELYIAYAVIFGLFIITWLMFFILFFTFV